MELSEPLKNLRKFARSGRLARRRKRLSARPLRNVSVLLLPRLRKPTKLMLLALAIQRRPVNPLPTLAVSVLNFPQSGISPLTARCLVSMELPAVEWFIRATDRWPILQTTLTRLTARAVKYISNKTNRPATRNRYPTSLSSLSLNILITNSPNRVSPPPDLIL
ncbi:hypothetical protein BDV26DRAFT_87968 [Aspergillus bertholletiae]|uniref:Uncharacterized protein n=1 Tax=Aspergillus bertholletiae TaxID=1226010 RepID=A0A5N7AUM9_9EURO|nr:hypothetical protein BDV26DRAFT_87968 [Aspergillus bertholletiae]